MRVVNLLAIIVFLVCSVGLTYVAYVEYIFSQSIFSGAQSSVGRILLVIGMGVCWVIFGVLVLRKLLGRRRR